MPKSPHVLTLLVLQVATVAGSLAVAAAPAAPHREPSRPVSVASNVRPVTSALLRPVTTPRRPAAARPAPRVTRRVTTSHRTARTHRSARPAVAPRPAPRLTFQQQVDRAAARIPGYRPGSVIWLLQANDGHWGTADWYAHAIWISPRVPSNRLFDVVVHEWSHLQSVAVYGGDVDAAVSAMNRYFGGTDLVGAERAADCMARLEGAQWTHYTPCADSHWRAGAARLLAGQRL